MFLERILAGGILLVLGRKLFWVYLAVLGFVVGLTLATRLFDVQPGWAQIAIGVVFGIVGALLAYFFQEIAVAVAGFFGGAYIAVSFLTVFAIRPTQVGDLLTWSLFIAGGIVGALLAVTLLDWVLVILTSLAGTLLVLEGFQLTMNTAIGALLGILLFAMGVVIQVATSQTLSGRTTAAQTTRFRHP